MRLAERELEVDSRARPRRGCPSARSPCRDAAPGSACRWRCRCRSSTRGCPSSATMICTSGSGRSVMSSPDSILWIDSAASWPCATAQMMFFGPKAASPPKNTFGLVEAMVLVIDLGHVPFVEFDADVALDPGEGVLLADRHQHVVAGDVLIRLAGRHQIAPALGVVFGLHLLEHHAGQLAVVVGEFLRHQEIEDRDVLVHGVLLFPGRRLHLLEAGAHDHLDVLAAEAARGAAAVHRGVAAAEHDDALADLGDVAERDRWTASRCRCGCSCRLPCGPECRARGRAARRSRRRSRRSSPPAASSCCRCAVPPLNSMPRSRM